MTGFEINFTIWKPQNNMALENDFHLLENYNEKIQSATFGNHYRKQSRNLVRERERMRGG